MRRSQDIREDRDRFVLSKGHVCPIQYSALGILGFFPEEDLHTLCKEGSKLQGHPSMNKCPGIDISTGSLGQGLSCAVGMALAGKRAGLATCGKIPFVVTYAVFGSLRMCEQIRQEICYPKLNVKIACSHGGVTPANDGASHQCIEDIGVLRTLPNMTVIMPADYWSARRLVEAAENLEAEVKKLTNGEGVDITFLAFGNAPVVESASKCTKEGGVISEITVIPNGTGCPYNMIQVKQQSLIESNMYVRKDYEVVVENMAKGRIDSKKMVSKIYPIEEFTAAMEMADKRTEPVVKVMLKF